MEKTLIKSVDKEKTEKKASADTGDKQATGVADFDLYRKRKLIERCRANPVFFLINFVRVKPKRGGRPVPFKLKLAQKIIMKAIMDRFFKPYMKIKGKVIKRLQQVRLIALKYRQAGLSTLIAALLLHDMLFFKGTEASIFLHKDEYSRDMLKRVKYLYKYLPAWMKPKRNRKDYGSASRLSFHTLDSHLNVGTPGKSRHLAGDKGRSQTLDAVMISELPRYPYAKDFLQGVTGAVKQGNIFMESTPLVKGDTFHATYEKGKKGLDYSEWLSLFFPWVLESDYKKPLRPGEAQRILASLNDDEQGLFDRYPEYTTAEKIKWRRITISDDFGGDVRRFKQEYPEDDESCFGSSGHMVFDDPEFDIKQLTITDLLIDDQKSNEATIIHREAIPGHFHMIGVDVAKGLGGDHDSSVIQVIDYDTQEQVYEFASNVLSDKMLPYKIREVYKSYPGVIGVEINNVGIGVMSIIRNDESLIADQCFQQMFYFHSAAHDGFLTTDQSKRKIIPEIYTALKEAVRAYLIHPEDKNEFEKYGLRIFSELLQYELSYFQDNDGKMGAISGTGLHDDRIIALAIAWYLRKFASQYKVIFERYEYYARNSTD